MATTTKQVYASDVDKAAATLGYNFTKTQNDLLSAYSLKEGATTADVKKIADSLNIKFENGSQVSARAVQLIAEQRFQHSSQLLSLFSALVDKVDQMKQRIISKFSNS
jgi:hypothetical protein